MASSRLAVIDAVLLAQAAGGRVAGVGEEPQAGLLLAPVELFERRQRHVDLAPHLQHVGRTPLAAAERLRHDLDRAHVGGDVLPHPAVAPGGRLHQPAALVAQRHGQAVDLQLAHVRRRGVAEAALHARPPRLELGRRERIVEALHRHLVDDLGERGRRLATDLLGGRVGGDEVGVLLLQGAQLHHQRVVVGVGDDRVVEVVVATVVLAELASQPVDAGDVVRRVGRSSHRRTT